MSDLDDFRRDLLAAMDPYATVPLGYLTVGNTVEMLGMAMPSQPYPAPEVAVVVRDYLDKLARPVLFTEAARMAQLLCHPNGLDQVRAQVEAAAPPPEPEEPPPEAGLLPGRPPEPVW